MRIASVPLVIMLAVLHAGCRSSDPTFVALDQLCRAHAEDLCQARATCCEPEQACEAREQQACELTRQLLVKEPALSYDGVQASEQLEAQRSMLAECEPPFAVARFFEGAGPNGEACERATQCASMNCMAKRCAAPSAVQLCGP